MVEKQPPGYLQASGIKHPARLYRRAMAGIVGEGVSRFTSTDLQVTAGPGSFQVHAGRGGGFVKGSDTQDQGVYFIYNDGNVNLTLNNPDGTNDRIDVIVAHVYDSIEGQTGDNWALEVVTGTPAGSPSVPTLPESSLDLAHVRVRHGSSSILNSDITDTRVLAPLVTASGSANCRVNKSSGTQSLPNGTNTVVTWDTQEFDTDGFYSGGAQDRLTIPSGLAGRYLVTVGVTFTDPNSHGTHGIRRNIKILKNSNNVCEHQIALNGNLSDTWSSDQDTVLTTSTFISVVDGDIIQASAYADGTGGALQIGDGVGQTHLEIVRLA